MRLFIRRSSSSDSTQPDFIARAVSKLKTLHPAAVGVGIFCLLLLLNSDSLAAPPFWDDIIGVHTQAIWLARNDFDIPTLFGMSRVAGSAFYNPTNPLCWIFAVTYRFFPPVVTHILAHLLNIAAVAGCSALLWNALKKEQDRFLFLLLALAMPLIVAACAGTGQETLLALLVFSSLICKMKNCERNAYLLALAACLCKLTALTLIFAYVSGEIIIQLQKKKLHPVKILLLLAGTAGTAVWYLYFFSFQESHFKWKPQECISLLLNAYYLLLPMFVLSVILLGRAKKIFQHLPLILFLLFYYAANAISAMPSLPRYGAVIVFPTVLLLASALGNDRRSKYITGGVILFSLFNIYGILLPEPATHQLHDGSFMERSREFTLMRSQDRLFCARLEKEAGNTPIVCTYPLLHMLTVPEFGYVANGLKEVYAGEYFHQLGNVRKMDRSVLQKNPVFIYTPDCFNWQIPRGAQFLYSSNPEEPLKGYILYRLPFNFSRSSSKR